MRRQRSYGPQQRRSRAQEPSEVLRATVEAQQAAPQPSEVLSTTVEPQQSAHEAPKVLWTTTEAQQGTRAVRGPMDHSGGAVGRPSRPESCGLEWRLGSPHKSHGRSFRETPARHSSASVRRSPVEVSQPFRGARGGTGTPSPKAVGSKGDSSLFQKRFGIQLVTDPVLATVR